jgi:hypothetical protein
MLAKSIKMNSGCNSSQSLLEIDQIYIDGCSKPGLYKKATLYDYLKDNPDSIQVNISPYPYLIPVVSLNGEKYVKSTPNANTYDNLLALPRV